MAYVLRKLRINPCITIWPQPPRHRDSARLTCLYWTRWCGLSFLFYIALSLSLSLSLSLIYVIIFWSLRFGRTFSSTDLKAAFTLKVGQTIDEHNLLQELPGDEDSNVDGKRKRDDSGDSDASSGSRKGKKKKKKKRWDEKKEKEELSAHRILYRTNAILRPFFCRALVFPCRGKFYK